MGPCAVAAVLFLLTGCKSIPAGRESVDAVTVRGARVISPAEIEEKIATTPSPKFLGLFRGVFLDYAVFDVHQLERDLVRIQTLYRSRGYWDARVRAGRVHNVDERHVRVELVVEEGEPVLVEGVRLNGTEGLDDEAARAVERAVRDALPDGGPFDDTQYQKAAGDARRALADRGYPRASVERDAEVDLVTRRADVAFTLVPGPRCTFGRVEVSGQGELPVAPILRAADIQEGARYSESAVEAARQAILDLGVFASVEIERGSEDDSAPGRPLPLRVRVEPTRLRAVRLGLGVELDALKADVHGVAGWESKNFLGGMRSFSATLRPGVVLYPVRVTNLVPVEQLLPEERLRLELRQPGFLEPRTSGFVRPGLDTFALLLRPDPPPDAPVLGYVESRLAFGVDRPFFKRLYAALSYHVQHDIPFAYVGERDPTLGNILVSYPELFAALDLRDDKVHPRAGLWIGADLQSAGTFMGDARDVRLQPDVRGYVPLGRRVVIALRGTIGLLSAQNYGRDFGDRTTVAAPDAARTKDDQLKFFRGFFSGGPTQNRGYPPRGVGPAAVVPFLSPEVSAAQVGRPCGEACLSPTGGFTLWEASAELRIDIDGPLATAIFCDASDVSAREVDFRFTRPHLSCGPGARYDTPVGPIRLDVGYRVPGAQVLGGVPSDEIVPEDLLGLPIAVAFAIGEAF